MSKNSDRSLFNFLSFIAIMVVGLGLLVMTILNALSKWTSIDLSSNLSSAVNVVMMIIQIFAYAIVAWSSYIYAKSLKGSVWWILWIIAVIVVIVCVILGFPLFFA